MAGLCAGIITAVLNTKLRLPALLAGILMMVGLYSVNLRIMGGANVSLLREPTIFNQAGGLLGIGSNTIGLSIIVALLIVVIVLLILNWFLRTELGLGLRATGDDEEMVQEKPLYSMSLPVFSLWRRAKSSLTGMI